MSPSLWKMEEEGRRLALAMVDMFIRAGAGSVLDVGCGSGELLRTIRRSHPSVEAWGADPYGWGRGGDGVVCRTVGAEKIDSIGRLFDIVITVMSLHHFSSVPAFLEAACRILSSDGTVIIVDWKHGVDTGIPEYYFTEAEIRAFADDSPCRLEDYREHDWHFVALLRRAA